MADAKATPAFPVSKVFESTRLLDAPRHTVWAAFTQTDHLKHWWGPKGLSVLTCDLDLRPGGLFHYGLRTPDGGTMWGRWMLREIDPPQRLEWINSFSDPDAGVTRHPMAPGWPAEMLCTASFTPQDGKTLLTLRSVAYRASEAEVAVFEANFDSLAQGFGGTWDGLEAYLAG